ncbi:MAG: septum formation initiator family protein [Defluviitaleaceae bacterium]|nr:septum formation initiator family protein [Defluviitaleaceae bacterium]
MRKASFGVKLLICLVVLAAFVLGGAYAINGMQNRLDAARAEYAAVQFQLELARAEEARLRQDAIYYQSHQFVERIARQWLGFVRRDEWIFIIED